MRYGQPSSTRQGNRLEWQELSLEFQGQYRQGKLYTRFYEPWDSATQELQETTTWPPWIHRSAQSSRCWQDSRWWIKQELSTSMPKLKKVRKKNPYNILLLGVSATLTGKAHKLLFQRAEFSSNYRLMHTSPDWPEIMQIHHFMEHTKATRLDSPFPRLSPRQKIFRRQSSSWIKQRTEVTTRWHLGTFATARCMDAPSFLA